MTLAAVQGQPRAVDALRAALRSGTVHHAYLFGGPEGVGKELAAIGFAQALECPVAPQEGCGECPTCSRIARRNHPDVTWLMPEDEQVARGLAGRSDFDHTPSRDLKVEQLRSLQERLSFRALEAPKKVAIIASAHRMNPQAQNAFLKTLEEPPPDTVLVLLASATDRLLPTIRSRCSKVHFGPLPRALIAGKLEQERKLDPATAALVAVMADGSLGRALELDVEGLSARREIVEQFEAVSGESVGTVLRFAEAHGGSRDDAELAIRILSLWNRDLAVFKAGGEEIANRDLTAQLEQVAPRVSEAELHRRHRLLERALEEITTRNASPRLQLERLLLEREGLS